MPKEKKIGKTNELNLKIDILKLQSKCTLHSLFPIPPYSLKIK
jgi:hypothetical protein